LLDYEDNSKRNVTFTVCWAIWFIYIPLSI
jgi:hypothetical protein